MPRTIAQRLNDAIAQQAAEVARLQHTVQVDLPAARQRLADLQSAAARVTPDTEAAVALLRTVGVSLDT